MFVFLLLVSALLTIGGFYSKDIWWLDFLSQFRLQYLGLEVCFCLIFLLIRNWVFVIISLIFAVINLSQIFPLYEKPFDNGAPAIGTIKIVITSANTKVPGASRVIMDYLYQKAPDILALTDLNEERLGALAEVVNQYTYKKFTAGADGRGIGLFSDWSLENVGAESYGKTAPGVTATFRFFGEPFTVLLTQLSSGSSKAGFNWRNTEISSIVSLKPTLGENLIVLGNLNMSSWSYHFGDFLKTMHLNDTRQGFGVQGTWPANIPVFVIPLDHCLTSENFRIVQREIGPYIGTDHLPLYIELELIKP